MRQVESIVKEEFAVVAFDQVDEAFVIRIISEILTKIEITIPLKELK